VTGAIKPPRSHRRASNRGPTRFAKDLERAGLREVRSNDPVRAPRIDLPPAPSRAPRSIPVEGRVMSSSPGIDPDPVGTSSKEAMPGTVVVASRRHRHSIEIRQLRYFVAAVEAGSLRSAESRIGVSQPAMTRQIHQLEEELGVELLVRKSRGIRPTDAGRVLFEDAVRILAMLERALQRVRAPIPESDEPSPVGGEANAISP
jgi:DNA-binding transcriptional ArsR family regulator